MKHREAPSLASADEDSCDISPLLRGETPAQPIRNGMVHVNYGSYTLAIRDGDWKLILPAGVYAVQDGTVTPDHVVETQGNVPQRQMLLYAPLHRFMLMLFQWGM